MTSGEALILAVVFVLAPLNLIWIKRNQMALEHNLWWNEMVFRFRTHALYKNYHCFEALPEYEEMYQANYVSFMDIVFWLHKWNFNKYPKNKDLQRIVMHGIAKWRLDYDEMS